MNDWYLGLGRLGLPARAASRCSASPTPSRSAPRRRAGPGAVSPDMPFEVLAHHAVDFWLCGEDLPQPDNRVTLDERRRDPPRPSTRRTTSRGSSGCGTSSTAMLGDLGMHEHHLLDHSLYLHKGMPIGATAHQAGTVRFGTDPASSRARRELQGARRGQPLRRRHQLLPEHRRGEPVADRHRQRAAGRRPPARATRLSTPDDPHRTDRRTCHGCRSRGRAGHLRSDRRPGQAGDLPRAGRAWSSGACWTSPSSGWPRAAGGSSSSATTPRRRCGSTAWTRTRRRRRKMLGLLRYVDGDLDDDATYAAMSRRDGQRPSGRCSTWRCRRPCSAGSPRASRRPAGPTAPG